MRRKMEVPIIKSNMHSLRYCTNLHDIGYKPGCSAEVIGTSIFIKVWVRGDSMPYRSMSRTLVIIFILQYRPKNSVTRGTYVVLQITEKIADGLRWPMAMPQAAREVKMLITAALILGF